MGEVLVALALLGLLVLIGRRWAQGGRRQDSPAVDVRITTRASSSSREEDTTTIESTDKGILLNRTGSLPIHINGIQLADIEPIIEAYRQHESIWHLKEQLGLLLAQSNAESPEVEAFLAELSPRYERAVQAALAREPGYEEWPEADRENFLEESREEAVDELEICCTYEDLLTLLHGRPADATVDDAITRQFENDPEGLRRFLRICGQARPYQAHDREDRQLMERLADKGLVIRGSAMPIEDILHTLRMKDIQRLLSEDAPRKFGRKADAIKFALRVEDMRDRIAREIPLRSMYKAAEAPGDTAAAAQSFRYCTEYAGLILTTFITEANAQQSRSMDFVARWGVVGDDCELCNRHYDKAITRRAKAAVPPHHVGCTCRLEPEFE